MKVVIWAGGLGSRISEESHLVPKPMIEVGGMPLIWHIMKHYSYYGHNEFILCLGYKQFVAREFFANYFLYKSDVMIDLKENKIHVHKDNSEPWKVHLIDTGMYTGKAGRLSLIREYLDGEPFAVTYGDGVSDVNINEVLAFHKNHGKIATITAVNVPQMKGVLHVDPEGGISLFREKQSQDSTLINGGYMILNPEVFDYIGEDSRKIEFEDEPMQKLHMDGELKAYYHRGFWSCMDTQREKLHLEKLWNDGNAPWKVWE